MLSTWLAKWDITTGSTWVDCDNQLALSNALDIERYKFIDSEFPDYDILSSIRYTMMTGI